MILKAFSFLDTKTGAFSQPFFFVHTGQAVRACVDLGSDLGTQIGRHPSDFALVEVGEFDDQSGVLTACAPVQYGVVASFLPQQPALAFPAARVLAEES